MAKLPVSVLSLVFVAGCYYGFITLMYFPVDERRVESWSVLFAHWLGGLVLLLLSSWILRSALAVERKLVWGLLGASRSSRRMTDLRETRDRAVADADVTLRRIERDLHDGAQARLIGVGMQLAMVSELIAAGAPPQRLRAAVDTTQGTLATAIAELRDLVRGIHPPVLDRGLEAALTTVVAGSAVPTALNTDLPRRPPPAIESIVYFSACELLTNAGRHGGARGATIEVSLRDDVLLLRVRDDGHGGAHPRTLGGLAGLVERVRVVDGRLVIDSPPGGPTTVTVEIPCSTRPEGS
jgi:signal transduction histidine kinase